MILYTIDGKGGYMDISAIKDLNKAHIYVNMTNKCPCACTFCLRQTKEMTESNTLWLKKEPTVIEVTELMKQYPFEQVEEVIFCGFGEPTERIYDILEVVQFIKEQYPHIKLRMNTNGLGNDIYSKDITPLLKDFNTISISLNAPTKEEYYELTRSKFGIDSFDHMIDFGIRCKEYVDQVVFTVVDIIGEEKIALCQKICDDAGVRLRVRPFEV